MAKKKDAVEILTDERKESKKVNDKGFSFGQELALVIIPTVGSVVAASVGFAASIMSLQAARIDMERDLNKIQAKGEIH